MNNDDLLGEVLDLIATVKNNDAKLESIRAFLVNHVCDPEEQQEIPKQYEAMVATMANNLDCGCVNILNKDTLEFEDVPEQAIDDPHEFEMITGENAQSMGLKYPGWKNTITIPPLRSREVFRIMWRFVDGLPEGKLRNQLAKALKKEHPFANFNHLLHNSNQRQNWFKFKQQELERYVWDLLRGGVV